MRENIGEERLMGGVGVGVGVGDSCLPYYICVYLSVCPCLDCHWVLPLFLSLWIYLHFRIHLSLISLSLSLLPPATASFCHGFHHRIWLAGSLFLFPFLHFLYSSASAATFLAFSSSP